MAIPKYDDIWQPALELLNDGTERRPRDFEFALAGSFGLTEEERAQLYPSGNGPIFLDRITWALSYLNMAGLVEKPKRGIYKISADGQQTVHSAKKIREYVTEKLAVRDRQKKKEKSAELSSETASEQTPQERLETSYEKICQSVYEVDSGHDFK
jgi:restriction system protein